METLQEETADQQEGMRDQPTGEDGEWRFAGDLQESEADGVTLTDLQRSQRGMKPKQREGHERNEPRGKRGERQPKASYENKPRKTNTMKA